jgi:hypothetical protein
MADKYDIDDLLSTAVDNKPADFAKVFNDILVDKITNSINDKKIEVAQNMFSPPEETEDENEEQEDLEQEETEEEED